MLAIQIKSFLGVGTTLLASALYMGLAAVLPVDATGAESTGAVSTLSQDETNDLNYMWEEEKLARDVYEVMLASYGHRVFQNISRAEQNHMDHVAQLMQAYGLPFYVNPNQRGSFSIPEIQALYDDFIAQGSRSLQDAFAVGQAIEIMDIDDLEARITSETRSDIKAVYEQLLAGSQRHLAAFNRQLNR